MNDTTGNGGGGTAKSPSREAFVAPRPRRFYREAALNIADGGFAVALDGRTAKTPGKRPLSVPTRALAAAIAAEWQAQGNEIHAETMPLTRLANTVIDGVASAEQAVRDDIVAFCGSDLVCYRAGAPHGLVEVQGLHWDPVLAWARAALGASFLTSAGIMHVAQPQAAVDAVARALAPLDAWRLTALHQITTLTGSALIALAHMSGTLSLEAAWQAAHVDEDWQISQWGEDAEAKARRMLRWQDMQAAGRLLDLIADVGETPD